MVGGGSEAAVSPRQPQPGSKGRVIRVIRECVSCMVEGQRGGRSREQHRGTHQSATRGLCSQQRADKCGSERQISNLTPHARTQFNRTGKQSIATVHSGQSGLRAQCQTVGYRCGGGAAGVMTAADGEWDGRGPVAVNRYGLEGM